ncbi:MAG: hypothetical protein MI919_18345 [Holophagales bacterium]|nr:hypothetical protein [Holophagales bacterium]
MTDKIASIISVSTSHLSDWPSYVNLGAVVEIYQGTVTVAGHHWTTTDSTASFIKGHFDYNTQRYLFRVETSGHGWILLPFGGEPTEIGQWEADEDPGEGGDGV